MSEYFQLEAIAESVWDLPEARFFRELTHALTWTKRMPVKHRKLLEAYAETGFLHRHGWALGFNHVQSKAILVKFCEKNGLGMPPDLQRVDQARTSPGEPDPDVCQDCPRSELGPHSPHGPVKRVL